LRSYGHVPCLRARQSGWKMERMNDGENGRDGIGVIPAGKRKNVDFAVAYPYTVFPTSKYNFHRIYLPGAPLYLGREGGRARVDRPGIRSRIVFRPTHRITDRRLLAAALPSAGPVLLKPSPPLRFSQKAKSFQFISTETPLFTSGPFPYRANPKLRKRVM
jgi:hypothetical protein